MARAEILFLAHRIPYPPDKGDKIRSWRTLEHLSRRFNVHLCAFVDDPEDFQHESFLKGVCKSVSLVALNRHFAKIRSAVSLMRDEPLSLGYYRDSTMRKCVSQVFTQHTIDLQYVFSSTMVPYADAGSAAPLIVDLCDADSEKWLQYADEAAFPLAQVYRREGNKLADFENDVINRAEATFAISPAEAALLQRDGTTRPVHWFGNGVDADYFNLDKIPELAIGSAEIVFVGAMDYQANVDAVQWFVDRIWRKVRVRFPEMRFAIVGSNPTAQVQSLDGMDGIIVTGRVDDVRPFLAQSKVVVAPMRIARGVQNKVLEAMAMGAALVGTSAAYEGLDVTPGEDTEVANDPEEFIAAIEALMNNEGRRRRLGEQARRTVVKHYSWSGQFIRFDDVLSDFISMEV